MFRVINPFLFSVGGFSPAVNGKMPVSAWIPSLDTAGNGTTTLTDIPGPNTGTLTNMDAATDWVSDTGEGGTTALDFDGTNDQVVCGATGIPTGTAGRSVSYWQYQRTNTSQNAPVELRGASGRSFTITPLFTIGRYFMWTDSVAVNMEVTVGQMPALNQWVHVLMTYDGSNLRYYRDGVLQKTQAYSTATATLTAVNIGRRTLGAFGTFDGRLDDIRIFDQVLDVADAVDLATGRGVNVA